MLRVLTLSTLFPDASRPNFGIFVERQTAGLAALPDTLVRVVAPVGLPPVPFDRLGRYAALRRLPRAETWRGLGVTRPRFRTLPIGRGRWHVPALVAALRPHLAAIRRDFPFDVIDAEFFFPDGPAAVALGAELGVPVSIKARGADIHHWGTTAATAAAVRDAGSAADGLLAVSDALRRAMGAIGIPAARVRVHRTGVDADRFAPIDRRAAHAALGIAGPLVLSVGALIERKGHGVVIDAVAAMPGVHLWIAGDGPLAAPLRARIAARGAGDRIRLLGSVPHADLPRLFAAADVMALASASEGLANAWVEALASGTPIVVTDAGGGGHEVVDRPAAGRVVARDADAFRAAIGELLANPPAQPAVRAAAARFSWTTNATELRAHLAALVDQASG